MNFLVSPRLKNLFSIASALVFLFGAAGYYLAFTVADNADKEYACRQMQLTSEQHKIICFSFSKSELQHEVRFVDRNEFIFHGERYDVVSRTDCDSQVQFQCYHDQRETALFNWFRRGLDHHSGDHSGKTSLRAPAPDWLLANNATTFIPVMKELITGGYLSFPVSVTTEIPTLPPNA